MYRLVTIIATIFFGFTTHYIHAQQGCLSEGISFPNQSSIDNFPSNYPGCDTILGDVFFSFNGNNNNVDSLYSIKCIQGDLYFGLENVTDLSGLNNLNRIEGGLTFYQTAFENFSGLENLQIVVEGVNIRENDSLLNLEGLNGLDSVLSSTLYIRNNLSLVDLNGLNNLDFTFSLNMYNNQSLQSINGLESLNQIGYRIDIFDNPNLTSLEGLIGLDTIGVINPYGAIRIENNNSLVSLTGLDSIKYMTQMLVLENDALESMQGFPKYAQQTRWTEIKHNISLTSLEGFDGVNFINGLNLFSNPVLENINSLADVDSIGNQNFNIDSCNTLINLNGLESVSHCSSQIVISNCNALDDISGLQSLTFLDGTIKLSNLPSLSSLEGLNNIEYVQYIYLNNLPEISDLSPLHNLDSAGVFNINRLNGISSLNGLDSLKKVYSLGLGGVDGAGLGNSSLQSVYGADKLKYIGSLKLGDNDSLINLDGFENVEALAGNITVKYNDRLTDINGLWDVTHSDNGIVRIENNPLLTQCSIDIICNKVLASTYTYISGNGNGCNSEEELLEGCSIFCNYNDLVITNQGQLYDFGQYETDCQIIAGNLDVSGYGVFDLSNLANIVEVRGYIKIHDCPSLTNLDGLDNIEKIYDYIQLENNEILTDISALNGIDPNTIDSLIIQGNDELSNCSIEAFCDYYLSSNSVMTVDSNNDGCNSILDFEDGCFGLVQNIVFTNQDEIDNFPSSCNPCNIINGNVLIEGSNITNLDSLQSIELIIGYLNIGGTTGNPNLTSISGLENLSFIGDELVINNNSSLTTLNGIAESENAMQLSDLESVGGNFEITNNNALLNLIGLEELTSVEGSMIISDNDELLSLTGIEDLDHSGITSITITNNPALSMCSVLSVCNYLDEASAMVDIFNNAEGCDSEAEVEINCIGVSITENELNKLIKIYPNPAHNELYITGLERKTFVNIYTQLGVLVLSTQIEEGIIDISGLNQGIYIIELKHEELRYRDKLIKK